MASTARQAIRSSAPAPWKHQNATRKFFEARPVGLDLSDPGTGKTRGAIEVYAQRKDRKRMLVVCPKTLMATAWAADIEKFAPHLTCSLAYAENRREAFELATDVVVINSDGVKWLADKENIGLLKGFDHLVIDEITAFKHHTSQRSKAMAKIRKYFKRRYGLTGTPNPNSVTEMWHPALIIDDGKRLGISYFKFRNVMQTPKQVGPSANHLKWDDKPGAQQAMSELLADITIRHAFEDVMTQVPPNHRDTKFFALSKKCRAAYDQMERDAILKLKEDVVSAVHAASLRTKLLQIASGAVYGEGDEYSLVDRGRYELVTDLVDERDHSIVFFNWRHQRDELCAEFEKRGVTFAVIDGSTPQRERDQIVKDYQAGSYQALLLHPRTGAHGLTLTRGTTTIVSSPIYEADLLKQAIHRIYRGGQTEVTNTILICAQGTVEEKVYARLDEKYERMVDLLDLIKDRRK